MWLAKLHHDGRAGERHQVDADATLRTGEDQPIDILITDVSATGCLFVSSEPIEVGSTISVGFAGLGKREARIVRADASGYGAEFATPLAEAELLAALAGPRDTIVPLAIPAPLGATSGDVAASTDRWPVPARFLAVFALAMMSWAIVLGLRFLL